MHEENAASLAAGILGMSAMMALGSGMPNTQENQLLLVFGMLSGGAAASIVARMAFRPHGFSPSNDLVTLKSAFLVPAPVQPVKQVSQIQNDQNNEQTPQNSNDNQNSSEPVNQPSQPSSPIPSSLTQL